MGAGRDKRKGRRACEYDSPLPCILLGTVARVLEAFRNVIALGASGDPTPPLCVSFLIIGISSWP